MLLREKKMKSFSLVFIFVFVLLTIFTLFFLILVKTSSRHYRRHHNLLPFRRLQYLPPHALHSSPSSSCCAPSFRWHSSSRRRLRACVASFWRRAVMFFWWVSFSAGQPWVTKSESFLAKGFCLEFVPASGSFLAGRLLILLGLGPSWSPCRTSRQRIFQGGPSFVFSYLSGLSHLFCNGFHGILGVRTLDLGFCFGWAFGIRLGSSNTNRPSLVWIIISVTFLSSSHQLFGSWTSLAIVLVINTQLSGNLGHVAQFIMNVSCDTPLWNGYFRRINPDFLPWSVPTDPFLISRCKV